MSHNSDNPLPKPIGFDQFGLPFRLTGSQAKTAFALRKNCEDMIAGNSPKVLRDVEYPCGTETRKTKVYVAEKAENLNSVGFLTLTLGDYDSDGKFVNTKSAAEASRRINNLNRRVLCDLFEKAIVVSERHKNGGVHFHIVGVLAGRPDIRTGFDFKAVREKNYESVSKTLRDKWAFLRRILPKYGFGRAELTPIEKTGEAIACYISKYIEKNLFNRIADDKRKKLVRYIGWNKAQLKPNEFSWGTKRATAWRMKARALAGLVGISDKDDMKKAFGARWSYQVTNLIRAIDDKPNPFFVWDFGIQSVARNELAKLNESWCIRRDREKIKRGNMHLEDIKEHCRWFQEKFPENFPKIFAASPCLN